MPVPTRSIKIDAPTQHTDPSGGPLDSQFHSIEVASLFAAEQQLAYMLQFESALAMVQGDLGLIPASAAQTIAAACNDRKLIARIDVSAARLAGNPAIPFVKQLTAHVQGLDTQAAGWVHRDVTSQDVIDTATMLALRDALTIIARDLRQLRETIAALARSHASTPMIARTLLQQATPTTLGYKLAAALAGLDQIATRLEQLVRAGMYLQLGGAVGTLRGAGPLAPELVAGVATRLGLKAPAICWHTNRVPIADCGSTLATLAGHLGKIARDVILEMQNEVGEIKEAPAEGKGGSSAMPHKHNPVDSVAATAIATTTPHLASALFASMVQEHERAAGAWHSEWIVLPQLCSLTHGALLAVTAVFRGLRIDAQRMQTNLEQAIRMTGAASLADALSPSLGRQAAHDLVQSWSQTAAAENRTLREVATSALADLEAGIEPDRIEEAFSIERDVAAARARTLDYLQQRTQGVTSDG